jgi:NADH-quinone oxidoreductase subunit L
MGCNITACFACYTVCFYRYFAIEPMLFGGFFKDAIAINGEMHPAMDELKDVFHGACNGDHGASTLPFALALGGVVTGVFWTCGYPLFQRPLEIFAPVKKFLDNKYYLDDINQYLFGDGVRAVGQFAWKVLVTKMLLMDLL